MASGSVGRLKRRRVKRSSSRRSTLSTSSGATKETWVYVVAGARPEPLLGDHNAEDLGVISFHPGGGDPHYDGQAQEGGQEGDH